MLNLGAPGWPAGLPIHYDSALNPYGTLPFDSLNESQTTHSTRIIRPQRIYNGLDELLYVICCHLSQTRPLVPIEAQYPSDDCLRLFCEHACHFAGVTAAARHQIKGIVDAICICGRHFDWEILEFH